MTRADRIIDELKNLQDNLPTLQIGGQKWWIAQGDLRLNAAGLRQLATERVDEAIEAEGDAPAAPKPKRLIANADDDGRIPRWGADVVLTYSVHRASFDTAADYKEIVNAFARAAADWHDACGVRFRHCADLDAKGGLPPEVVFSVQQRELPGYIALAFFPGDAAASRVLLVDPSWFTTRYDQVGVFRHELGHVLGFRHEHLNAAPPECRGTEIRNNAVDLTAYDPQSTMHYPCGRLGTSHFGITETDKEGARKLYGPTRETGDAYKDVDPSKEDVAAVPAPAAVGAPQGKWQYTQSVLPGVAMLDTTDGFPRKQKPKLKWYIVVTKVALGIAFNRLAGLGGGGLEMSHLEAGTARPGDESEEAKIAAFLEAHGEKTIDELEAATGLTGGLANETTSAGATVRAAVGLASQRVTDPLVILRQVSRNADLDVSGDRTIEQYRRLFRTLEIPKVLEPWPLTDEAFALLRVAGCTTMPLHKVDKAPFTISDELLASATGAGDTVAAALGEGRLYCCNYKDVGPGQLKASSYPYGRKYALGPILALALPPGAGERRLVPVAIKNGLKVHKPSDDSWAWARLAVQQADSNRHELVDHLGRTHLFIGPIGVALQRCLPADHPIGMLLWAHLEGTLSINDTAVTGLLGEGKPVDKELAGTIESSKEVAVKGLLSQDFADYAPDTNFANRGVDDSDLHYPYRDDALLVWAAVLQWTTAAVDAVYADDAAVAADSDLNDWQREMIDPLKCNVQGFGNGGQPYATRADLARCLAIIIFTASAQHAAVNFPQRGLMAYCPGVPGALYSTDPSDPLLEALPPLQIAQLQVDFLSLLGGVHYTRLGDYRKKQLPHVLKTGADRFAAQLELIGQEIDSRNATRPLPYPYLHPDLIPQSINI